MKVTVGQIRFYQPGPNKQSPLSDMDMTQIEGLLQKHVDDLSKSSCNL